MRIRFANRHYWLCLVAWLAVVGTVVPAHAQVRVPTAAPISVAELDEVIRQGEALERESRWHEALAHYEQALRAFPEHSDLQQRLDLARIHLDQSRRFADASFLDAQRTLDEAAAITLYSELLLKIHTHYVHSPNWRGLVERGITDLEVMTQSRRLPDRDGLTMDTQACGDYLLDLRDRLAANPMPRRQDAVQFVTHAARTAESQLGLEPQVVALEFVCAATGSLDEYSSFLTGHQLDEVFSQIEGNFVGLGVELKCEPTALLVVNVIAGSTAERGGIRSGDRIVAVDGQSIPDISSESAADMLKGEEGSTVEVNVRDGRNATRRMRLERRRVDVPSVEGSRILDAQHGVAYFRITSFQKTTSRDVDQALWDLHRQGMRTLIMDLRGNPGGLLNSSVEVADKFINSGTIVSTRGRSPQEDFDYKAHSAGTWRVPLIVLIDGDSASASEIFAGAIYDHRRGTLVGERSYGKGSVQGIFPLEGAHAGVRLTTAKFYSPSGQPISRRGVQPNVVVHAVARPVTDPEAAVTTDDGDAMLRAALQVARQQVSRRPQS